MSLFEMGKNVKWIIKLNWWTEFSSAVHLYLPVHDWLQNGGKGRYADTSPYKNSVLGPVEVAWGTSKWSIYVNLERKIV